MIKFFERPRSHSYLFYQMKRALSHFCQSGGLPFLDEKDCMHLRISSGALAQLMDTQPFAFATLPGPLIWRCTVTLPMLRFDRYILHSATGFDLTLTGCDGGRMQARCTLNNRNGKLVLDIQGISWGRTELGERSLGAFQLARALHPGRLYSTMRGLLWTAVHLLEAKLRELINVFNGCLDLDQATAVVGVFA